MRKKPSNKKTWSGRNFIGKHTRPKLFLGPAQNDEKYRAHVYISSDKRRWWKECAGKHKSSSHGHRKQQRRRTHHMTFILPQKTAYTTKLFTWFRMRKKIAENVNQFFRMNLCSSVFVCARVYFACLPEYIVFASGAVDFHFQSTFWLQILAQLSFLCPSAASFGIVDIYACASVR